MNKVSIVLCLYNGEKYLSAQIKSILRQTHRPDEIVIVDDNSSDESIKIAKNLLELTDIQIHYILHEINRGHIVSFEEGTKKCSGDYIFFCDQDDVWLPHKIADGVKEIKKLENNYGKDKAFLSFCKIQVVDKNLKLISEDMLKGQKTVPYTDKNSISLFVQNYITGHACVINKNLKDLALPISKDAIGHDWWFACIAVACGHISYIENPGVLYRQHGNNVIGARKIFSFKNFKKTFTLEYWIIRFDKIILQAQSIEKFSKEVQEISTILSRGGLIGIYRTFQRGVMPQRFFRKIIFCICLLLRKYRI